MCDDSKKTMLTVLNCHIHFYLFCKSLFALIKLNSSSNMTFEKRKIVVLFFLIDGNFFVGKLLFEILSKHMH